MDWSVYPFIAKARNFSEEKLGKLTIALKEKVHSPNAVVVAAGSYARKEASESSDLDFMVFDDSPEEAKKIDSAVREIAERHNISRPNKEGVFHPLNLDDMISVAGFKNETLDQLAQRLLLLMEAYPLYNKKGLLSIQKRIINFYFSTITSSRFPVFLLNDTIRYFRHICVNYQFTFTNEPKKWCVRNIKLRHSRLIMYAGLLFLILNSCNENDISHYIISNLPLTPLERIANIFHSTEYKLSSNLFTLYDNFLSKISDPDNRSRLLEITYDNRYNDMLYRYLKDNSDNLIQALFSFTEYCKTTYKWDSRVFEYLLF